MNTQQLLDYSLEFLRRKIMIRKNWSNHERISPKTAIYRTPRTIEEARIQTNVIKAVS